MFNGDILQRPGDILGDVKSQIRGLGINAQDIENEVDNEIEQTQITTFSEDDFFKDVNTVMQNNKIDYNTSLEETLKYYKSKGFSIEGVNIDRELNVEIPTPPKKEKAGFFKQTLEAPGRIIGAGLAGLPEAAGNVAGFTVGKLVDDIIEKPGIGTLLRAAGFTPGSLEEQFKTGGKEDTAQLQEILGIDPEGALTTIGEFGTDIALLATPGGQTSLIAKTPQLADKVRKIGDVLNKLKTSSPKIYAKVTNILKSGSRGAEELTKFATVSEGDVTKEDLALGFVGGAAIDKITKVLSGTKGKEVFKKINERFAKLATKLSPSKTTKTILDKKIKKGTEGAFIIRGANPNLKLSGDDAVSNILEASKTTRNNLFKEMSTLRGEGVIKPTNITKWIDDVVDVLKNPSKAKNFAFERGFQKQFRVLDNIADTDDVVRALLKEKANIVSKGERSFSQWDDLIINRNKKLSNFFNQSGKEKVSTEVSAAVASKMKSQLDDSIGALGNQFRKSKDAYSKVRTFEDNLNKVYAQILRRKDAQLGDFADAFILSNMGANIATGNFGGLGKDVLTKLIKDNIKKQNDPNIVLEQMFKLIDRELKIAPTGIIETTKRGIQEGATKLRGKGGIGGSGNPIGGFNTASPAKSAKILNKVEDITESTIKQTNIKAKDRFDISFLKKGSKIGEGTDRVVYDIGNNQVLKVAKNKRGIDQNLGALNTKLQDSGILAKVDEVGKDFVIMEKLPQFGQLSTSQQTVVNNLVKDIKNLVKQEADIDTVRKVLKKYGWDDVADLNIKTFGWGDVVQKNLSFKNGKPVLIDEGTIDLIRVLKKYKRKVILAPVKVGAIIAVVQGLDADTLYQIKDNLIGGDVIKKNTLEENKKLFNLAPKG